jgi:hypothetical protein
MADAEYKKRGSYLTFPGGYDVVLSLVSRPD